MKTIKITLPADNITLTAANGYTTITYDGLDKGRSRQFTHGVFGDYYDYTLENNLLTLK